MLTTVAVLTIVGVLLWTRKTQKINLPGPKGIPYFGSFFAFDPKVPLHRVLGQWSEEFGDVYTFAMGAKNFVVLNSSQAAKDILIDHADVASSRPRGFLYKAMQMDIWGISFWNVGEKWREHRNRFTSIMSQQALQGFDAAIQESTDIMVDSIKTNKAVDISDIATKFGYDASFRVAFGIPLPEDQDFITTSREFFDLNSFAADLPVYFPFLSMFWGSWLRKGDAWWTKFRKVSLIGLKAWIPDLDSRELGDEAVTSNVEADTSRRDSLCYRLLKQSPTGLSNEELATTCGLVTLAASEQTGIIIKWICAILATHPDLQARLHSEIKIGSQDKTASYPYLQAFLKEVLRFRPPASISGFPRQLQKDISYRNAVIPAGTLLMTNAWAIQHGSEFPDGDVFDPDRFLGWDKSSQAYAFTQPLKRDTVLWGWGARICPGIRLTEKTVWSAAVALVSNFEIIPADPKATWSDVKLVGDGPICTYDNFKLVFNSR